MADKAQTIDSLLVSLGLDLNEGSFKKGASAIKGVTDGMLQLAAVAGVGMGFNALTSGVARSYADLKRLGDITGFTINQIRGLEFAMRRIGANPESGQRLAQMVPELARRARYGELGEGAYRSTKFSPEHFAKLESTNSEAATEYLFSAYRSMSQQERQWFRPAVGWGENDDIARLAEYGGGFLRQSMGMSAEYNQAFDPEMNKNVQEFNDEMAKLSRNFENLAFAMGGKLLPVVNSLLESINKFIKENPEISQAMIAAAGVGGTAAAMKIFGRLTGFGGGSSSGGGGGFLSRLLFNPVTTGAIAAFTPGNIFTSDSDARAMSNPALNWQQRHPGQTLPEGGVTPEQAARMMKESDIDKAVDDPNARKYLDAISRAEGTAAYMNNGYNTLFGGGQFSDMRDHPRVMRSFQQTDGEMNKTSAAGRYQFTQASWDEAAAALGLTDFSPRSQDLAALWLIQRAGQLDNVLGGNFTQATNGLGGVWASLPSSPYAQPKRSMGEMSDFYGYGSASSDIASYGISSPQQAVSLTQNVDLHISGVGMDEQQIQDSVNRAITESGRNLELSYNRNSW